MYIPVSHVETPLARVKREETSLLIAGVGALLWLCWWFRTVALAQPPYTTSVRLETRKLIKNGFGQVAIRVKQAVFCLFFFSRDLTMKFVLAISGAQMTILQWHT